MKHIIKSTLITCLFLAPSIQADNKTNIHDLTNDDPFYYTQDQFIKDDDGQKEILGVGRPNTTHSHIPHLPVYSGYMSTNYTYRFVNIVEQVLTMIGEGKHGLWRAQENGMIREYLAEGKRGLKPSSNIFAANNQRIINNNYSHYLPTESWSGYKYPDQKLSPNGELNYIDLPMNHPKYQGKYARHVPVDLPNFYCTMSGADYVYARKALDFAFNQPVAGEVGTLGKRAGLDVNENYTKILRLHAFPDGRSWINVGQKGKDAARYPKWEAVDERKTKAEYYLVERPFFNVPYLFVTAVYDNQDNQDFQYVRPDGAYYDSLKKRRIKVKTKLTQRPRFHLENGQTAQVTGLPLFGVHHHNRDVYGGGGACPLKGGDYGRYPDVAAGSAWPTQYEEITPLCDGVLVDIKFYTNLQGGSWNNPNRYLANAGVGKKEVTYKIKAGRYGAFADPYLLKKGIKNPEEQTLENRVRLTFPTVQKPTLVNPPPAPHAMGRLGETMLPLEGTSCRPILDQLS